MSILNQEFQNTNIVALNLSFSDFKIKRSGPNRFGSVDTALACGPKDTCLGCGLNPQ